MSLSVQHSKAFAVQMILLLADDYEQRAMQKKQAGEDFQDWALASILARDLAYQIGGKYFWGRSHE